MISVPGRKPFRRHLEPVAGRRVVLEQGERASERPHRDVEIAVVVVIRLGTAACQHRPDGRQHRGTAIGEDPRPALRGQVQERVDALAVRDHARNGNLAVHEDKVGVCVEVEVAPAHSPARRPAQVGAEVVAHVVIGRIVLVRRLAAKGAVGLSASVGHEEVRAPVPVVVRSRDAHPAAGIGDTGSRRPLLEPKAEPGRVGARPARPGNVLVEPVGVRVVGDEDVEVAVQLEIREQHAEAVLEADDLETRFSPHLAKGGPVAVAALVQIEQVPTSLVRVREALRRTDDRLVEVGVAGHDEVRPPVAVEVARRRTGVPAEGIDPRLLRSLGEAPVAVVPQQPAELGRRHEEVGMAVEIQVGGDTALSPDGEPGSGLLRHVGEATFDVSEETARRQPARGFPAGSIAFGVAVDDEEIEPAVLVVVEPAQAATDHCGRIGLLAEAEGSMPEAKASLRGHVA